MSVLLLACAGGQATEPTTAAKAGLDQHETPAEAGLGEAKPALASTPSKGANAERNASSSAGQVCTPSGAAPKIVTGDDVSDVAESGQALIFDVAGIALELPACTPDADIRVIAVAWDTKGRPNAARIHPNFTRHAATLRVSQAISAREGAPLLVRLHSKRELAKHGEKLVLAVESSGECDAQHKQDKLDDGDCSHWQLFDAAFDAASNEMVARIPATGGYRLQFGWVPNK
jgi:hypothetical protein